MAQNWLQTGAAFWGGILPYVAELALLSLLWAATGPNFQVP